MFTGKTVLIGLTAVLVLYAGMWVYKSFSQISGGRTSGPGVIVPNLISVLTNPGFWAAAVLLFFAIAFLTARLPVRHS